MGFYLYRGNGSHVAAVIVIDANAVKMKISQIYRSKISTLETLEYPVSIGHEVFSTGKISFESVREVSSILNGYIKLIDEYKVLNYRVVGTTAIGEAENADFVIDQLKVKNGLNVEIMESNYEESLIYSNVIERIKDECDKEGPGAVIANINTAYLGLSLYKDNFIKFSHNLPIGYMRCYDMFSKVMNGENDFRIVLEEYMSVLMKGMEHWIDKKDTSKIFITVNDINLISEILHISCNDGLCQINIQELKKYYGMFSSVTEQKLSLEFGIEPGKVKLICSILSICLGVSEFAKTDSVNFLKTELLDCIMFSMLNKKDSQLIEESIKNSTIESAQSIANYYRCDKKHRNLVCENAGAIFDRLKKIHGLNQRKKLLLQIACIMHECGNCINLKNPNESVFNTVKSANIYGLSLEENLIVACIAGCSDCSLKKYESEAEKKLSVKNKLIVSKLTAIFLVSNALDISCKQKLPSIKVKINQGEVIVTGKTDKKMLFEQWEFRRCSNFFKEVFGMNIKLLVKPKNLAI